MEENTRKCGEKKKRLGKKREKKNVGLGLCT